MEKPVQSTLLKELSRPVESGSAAYRRINFAMFLAGFTTFALLYNVQPLLPVFSREFSISAAQSSLAVSFCTGALALGLLAAGSLSEVWGRKPIMVGSILAAAVLSVLAAFVSAWNQLLFVRTFQGIAISGLPAVAMAYLTEELDSRSLGLAMGLYIGGTGLGGMAGRMVGGVLTDLVSWRFALGAIGAFCLLAALAFWRSLPTSVRFSPVPFAPRGLLAVFADHARDEGLPWLFAEAFFLGGGFVSVFNYIGYRLVAPPFGLSHTAVGAVFVVYVAGVGSSAWVGHLAGKLGRRNVLWMTLGVMLIGLLITLPDSLVAIIVGLVIFTIGFFGGHSILASWVGLRAWRGKAQASGLYLFSYYMGASIVGWCGGYFWSSWGWLGVTAFVGGLLIVALLISLWLTKLPPRGYSVSSIVPS